MSDVAKLQAENTLLKERLKRYEEVFGPLRASGSSSTTSTSEQVSSSPQFPKSAVSSENIGKPLHHVARGGGAGNIAASTLVINFSQDENAPELMQFPNPYFATTATNANQQQPHFPAPTNTHQSSSLDNSPEEKRQPSPRSPDSGTHLSVVDDDDIFANEPPTYSVRPSFAAVGAAAHLQDYRADAPHVSTQLVLFDAWSKNDPYKPSSMPIYQTSTFIQESIERFGNYDYTRSSNPTRTALEIGVAKLEGAEAAFAFTSGMAAIQSVFSTLKPGDHVVACGDLYGGAHRLLTFLTQHQGLEVSFVDTTDLEQVRQVLHSEKGSPFESKPTPKLVHLESPSNPMMRITDLKKVSEMCHEVGALVSVDCTMMTPLRQQPLQLGCDVVIHSGTKFFAGHSDCMAGFAATKNEVLAKKIAFVQNAGGSALAPFDSWLILRGLKTLFVRLERQETNAVAVARFLLTQKKNGITKVHYAGLEPKKKDDPSAKDDLLSSTPESYALHCSQASGPSTVISFETGSVKRSKKFVDACRLFKITVSFGSVNSLVEMPTALSHASIRKEARSHLPEDLIRLSIGCEHAYDLIADLMNALKTMCSVSVEDDGVEEKKE